jgi:membrane fusion protein, multidrug efflux system
VLAGIRRGEEMPVEAFDSEMKERLAKGTLFTIDNQIDTTTGTVRVKAIFANEEAALFPNQFVNVRLVVLMRRGAVVVPASAIQRGPSGPFVYIVREDSTAAVRPVSVGEIQEGSATILTGVTAGEMVVTDGAARLRDGASVEIAKGRRN